MIPSAPPRCCGPRCTDRNPPANSHNSCRAGFSLLEVLVALTISGILLLGARAMLEQLADDSDRITQSITAADREANAERLLRTLVGRVEASGDSVRFSGHEQAARFTTWCDVPAGWQERCEVTIGVVQLEEVNVLTVLFPAGEVVPLRRGFESGSLRYLHGAGNGGVWLRSWTSTITTPLALGVILDGDTLIIRIGERG